LVVGKAGARIPSRYLGFNLEMSTFCQVLAMDAKRGPYYEQLFRNLGPGILHVGGQSTDLSVWRPEGDASCSAKKPVITTTEVRAFFTFVNAIGWKVIWGLPLARFNPSLAADEAKQVEAIGGNAVTGFSIGNEPDLYPTNGDRPATWTFAKFFGQWERVREAVLRAVPGASFVGPEACCVGSFVRSFAADAKSEISALSFHFYSGSRERFTPLTISHLMTRSTMIKFTGRTNEFWDEGAKPDRLPLYLTESNTFSDGGVTGVSNTFAAGLWLTNLLFQAAGLHISQVDVQESKGTAPYNAIGPNGVVAPIYYGMLWFQSVVGSGPGFQDLGRLAAVKLTSHLNLVSYAIDLPDGSTNVVLINKDERGAVVTIHGFHAYNVATVSRLKAPRLNSVEYVTAGNRTVADDGTWTPVVTPVVVQHGLATIHVRSGTAVCVNLISK
jgi:hypothetical protein